MAGSRRSQGSTAIPYLGLILPPGNGQWATDQQRVAQPAAAAAAAAAAAVNCVLQLAPAGKTAKSLLSRGVMRGPKLETERFLLIIEQPPDLIRGIVRWGTSPKRAEINASRRTVAFVLTPFTTPTHTPCCCYATSACNSLSVYPNTYTQVCSRQGRPGIRHGRYRRLVYAPPCALACQACMAFLIRLSPKPSYSHLHRSISPASELWFARSLEALLGVPDIRFTQMHQC